MSDARRGRSLAWPLFLFAAAAASALAWATHGSHWQLPDRWNPWRPLVVADTPGLLTRWKLRRLDDDAPLCRAVLDGAGVQALAVASAGNPGAGCAVPNAVRVRRGADVALGSPLLLSCRSAVSLALWERHVLLPHSRMLLGSAVARIDHLGSYACRNVNHAADGGRSRHASADAIDIAGFVLADGRRVSVLRDWQRDGTAALFLRAARDGACRHFDGVLGPEYNAAHADHLHLERGGFGVCR